MNKKLKIEELEENSSSHNKNSPITKISNKSSSIKAKLKSKYLLYKLERDFYHKKYE